MEIDGSMELDGISWTMKTEKGGKLAREASVRNNLVKASVCMCAVKEVLRICWLW